MLIHSGGASFHGKSRRPTVYPYAPRTREGRGSINACDDCLRGEYQPMPAQETEFSVPANQAAWLMGLAMTCPVGKDNPSQCPLHEIRNLPLAQRFDWVRSLASLEADNILGYHTYCCPRMQDEARRRDLA